MKKVLLAGLVVGTAFCGQAAFAHDWGMAGCGLGAMAFKDQPGKIQILAATVNNIVSPQTFAITSGTSNCVEGGAHEEAALFITMNQEALQKDVARGNGETIASLSQILGCQDADQLGENLHKSYSSIFPTTKVEAKEVTHAIDQSIQGDHSLMKTCKIYG